MIRPDFNEFAHKIAQRASKKIFSPSIEEKAILYSLAKDGPQILTDLEKTTSYYGLWETNRFAVRRMIKGTKTDLGLIKYEYVNAREHDNRIRGKDGEIYCLTIKGLLTSLSTGLSLERTYLFKKYAKFIKYRLNQEIQLIGENRNINPHLDEDTKNILSEIIIRYIKNQIYLFLIWHEASEITLRNKIDMDWYLVDFFNKHDEFISQEFPKIIDEKRQSEYRDILREYFTCSKILHGITYFIEKKNSKINKQFADTLELNFKMISPFIFDWYRHFDKLQIHSPIDKPYSNNSIRSFVLYPPEIGIDIVYSGTLGNKRLIEPNIRQVVKSELGEILKVTDLPLENILKVSHDTTGLRGYGLTT